MKADKFVMSRTPSGLMEVKAFWKWKEVVAGASVQLALHKDPDDESKLMISEISTGLNTLAVLRRPGSAGEPMNTRTALATPARIVRSQAKSAFHHLIKQKGALNFIRSVAIAQINVQKMGESLQEQPEEEPCQ